MVVRIGELEEELLMVVEEVEKEGVVVVVG